jgi:UDP-N-acetylmuramoylalanine--D-glutamate ligase
MDYAGRKVLVLGYGISGRSAAKLLKFLGADVSVWDDSREYNDEYIRPENLDLIDLVIVSPGISMSHKVLAECAVKKIPRMSELEFGASMIKGDMIAVTGTNGKTTTTMLISAILNEAGFSAKAMGNIGEPVTDFSLKLISSDIAVIEVSSFQMEHTSFFAPKVAAITNIAPDHLDRHGSYEEYISAKLKLFCFLREKERAVINYDYDILRELSLSLECPITYFSSKYKVKGCYIQDGNIYMNGKFVMALEDVPEGHHMENILCALSVCLPLGISSDTVKLALQRFKMADYRMTALGIKSGKMYYNDSKGTNIHSTLSACKSVSGSTALILGGSDKGEDFRCLFSVLPKNIKEVYVSGGNACSIIKAADICGYDNVVECADLSDCVKRASEGRMVNVLFSPASASFDRFRDYKERGAAFDKIYEELP